MSDLELVFIFRVLNTLVAAHFTTLLLPTVYLKEIQKSLWLRVVVYVFLAWGYYSLMNSMFQPSSEFR